MGDGGESELTPSLYDQLLAQFADMQRQTAELVRRAEDAEARCREMLEEMRRAANNVPVDVQTSGLDWGDTWDSDTQLYLYTLTVTYADGSKRYFKVTENQKGELERIEQMEDM